MSKVSDEIKELQEKRKELSSLTDQALGVMGEMEKLVEIVKAQNDNFSYVCYEYPLHLDRFIEFTEMVQNIADLVLEVNDSLPELTKKQKETIDQLKNLQTKQWTEDAVAQIDKAKQILLNK